MSKFCPWTAGRIMKLSQDCKPGEYVGTINGVPTIMKKTTIKEKLRMKIYGDDEKENEEVIRHDLDAIMKEQEACKFYLGIVVMFIIGMIFAGPLLRALE